MADIDPDKAKGEEIARLKVRVDEWLMRLLAIGFAGATFYGLGAGTGAAIAIVRPVQLFTPFVGMLLALSVAGAALGLGVFAGFLFGLPRALTNPEVRQLGNFGVASEAAPAPLDGIASDGARHTPPDQPRMMVGKFAINTNLERISDWLTTMIVGIGLANLNSMIPAIEAFGERFEPVFGIGGKVFAIGCGLYFLIFGFLVSYISTRTKLTLIFTENEYDATSLAQGRFGQKTQDAVAKSSSGSVFSESPNPPSPGERAARNASPPGTTGTLPDAATVPRIVQQLDSDKRVIETIGNAQRASSREELVALANARARSGDAEGAVNLYQEIVRSSAFDAKIWLDYCSALGLANREQQFIDLLPEIRTKGTAANEAEARSNFAVGLLGTLQAHLYDGQYDKSIAAGETLERYPLDASRAPWKHIWLACAYGQRHAAIKDDQERAKQARDAAYREVESATRLDPMSKTLLRSLYDPAPGNGDRDLESLKPDPELETLFAAPDVAPAATERSPTNRN